MSVRADSYLSICHTYVTTEVVSTYLCMHGFMLYAYLANVNVGCVYPCNAGCMCTLQTLMKGVYTPVHSKCDH